MNPAYPRGSTEPPLFSVFERDSAPRDFSLRSNTTCKLNTAHYRTTYTYHSLHSEAPTPCQSFWELHATGQRGRWCDHLPLSRLHYLPLSRFQWHTTQSPFPSCAYAMILCRLCRVLPTSLVSQPSCQCLLPYNMRSCAANGHTMRAFLDTQYPITRTPPLPPSLLPSPS